jgi:large subunit ribosomal protein L19
MINYKSQKKKVIRCMYDRWVEEDTQMNIIDKITNEQLNPNVPEFRVGDTVAVGVNITETKRDKKNNEKIVNRVQLFEGIVTARKGSGISETFTVRKMSSGIGVNRIFPVHSPNLASITVIKKGKVRRAKLNFLKSFVGQFKIKERN